MFSKSKAVDPLKINQIELELQSDVTQKFCSECSTVLDGTFSHNKNHLTQNIPAILSQEFKFKKSLGKGGFGLVFKVESKETGEVFALKILASGKYRDESEKDLWQILKNLDHVNVIKYIRMIDGKSWIAILTSLAKSDLKAKIRNRKLSESDVLMYFVQICNGLLYLHSQQIKIIHRDLKPANILIDKNGIIKIIDFGISKKKNSGVEDPSFQENPFGTEIYCPYEYFQNIANSMFFEYNDKTDIWSLGVIFHEMLCGRHPFEDPEASGNIKLNIKEGSLFIDEDINPFYADIIRCNISLIISALIIRCLTRVFKFKSKGKAKCQTGSRKAFFQRIPEILRWNHSLQKR